jgi:hypothetical protein
MDSFRVQAAAPLPHTGKAAPDGIQEMGYDAQVRTVVWCVRPRIWAVVVIALFVICTVGGMSAQIANQGGKEVETISSLPGDDPDCGRGDHRRGYLTSGRQEALGAELCRASVSTTSIGLFLTRARHTTLHFGHDYFTPARYREVTGSTMVAHQGGTDQLSRMDTLRTGAFRAHRS